VTAELGETIEEEKKCSRLSNMDNQFFSYLLFTTFSRLSSIAAKDGAGLLDQFVEFVGASGSNAAK